MKLLKLAPVASVLVMASLLGGCAGSYLKANHPESPEFQCTHAKVLYTNLSVVDSQRKYMLKDGFNCTRYVLAQEHYYG